MFLIFNAKGTMDANPLLHQVKILVPTSFYFNGGGLFQIQTKLEILFAF